MMRNAFLLSALTVGFAFSREATAQNLITNGSFETGTFAGWTQTGSTAFNGVECPGVASVVQGICDAFFGPVGAVGGISQVVTTTIGQSYNFSFWMKPDGGVPGSFEAFIGGNSVFLATNPPASAYVNKSFNYVATSTSTTVAFNVRDDPGFMFLDDVRVTTPEPSTYALMAAGLLALGVVARRRRTT